jgi:hypothetical protein
MIFGLIVVSALQGAEKARTEKEVAHKLFQEIDAFDDSSISRYERLADHIIRETSSPDAAARLLLKLKDKYLVNVGNKEKEEQERKAKAKEGLVVVGFLLKELSALPCFNKSNSSNNVQSNSEHRAPGDKVALD